MNNKKIFKIVFFCALISIFFEIFIFNFRSIQSIVYKAETLNKITFGSGIRKKSGIYVVEDSENAYLEITNINKIVNNIKFDINILSDNKYIIYNIFAADEGNKYYYSLPERYYYPKINKSKYVKLDLSGKASKLKIEFKDCKGLNFKLNEISINNKVPFSISILRIVLIFIIIFCLYIFRPKSEFYKYKINFKSKKQKIIIAIFIFLEAWCFLNLINSNEKMKNLYEYSNHNQYYQLTKALANKKVYLDIEPSKEIKEMENPYDYGYRKKLTDEQGAIFEWDRAYYNGKYYVYFGIVPVITTYLPFYLLTHYMLPNYIAVYFASLLMMVGLFLLLKEVTKRYFKNIPFLIFILIYFWLLSCSGIVGILCYPTLYNVPITFALMFTYFGLYFWLSSIKKNEISKLRIFLGSLCMALVAGCRPQLLVGSFFAIFIFWNSIFKERKLFSKKGIFQTLLAIIPYMIVAAFIMYYNKIRFGSIFDFGANYNITGNDMTRRGFNIDRIGLGLFMYLFQPFNLKATFPFLVTTNLSNNYMGTTIFEQMFGGILFTNPVLLFGIIIFKFKKKIKNDKIFKMGLFSLILGLLLVILDTQMAGILQRYVSDFCWLFCIPTIFVVFSIFNDEKKDKLKKIVLEILIGFVIFSIIYQFLYMFDDQLLHDMINNSTSFYFKWYYLLQWWL